MTSKDVAGSAIKQSLKIEKNGFILTPGRYVGAPEEDDGEPFDERMKRLTTLLKQQKDEERN